MTALALAKKEIQRLLKPYFGEAEIKIDLPPSQYVADFSVPVFSLAKEHKKSPGAIATELASALVLEGSYFSLVEAQGGFLNFSLNKTRYIQQVFEDLKNPRYGVPKGTVPMRVVIDYSSPNAAKEMHVGHLRSTVIGDSLHRLYDFLGHEVIAQNHFGDWGTQFGMLIEYLLEHQTDLSAPISIGDLNVLYQMAKQKDDSDPDFSERARKRVVLLQQGDKTTRDLWQALIQESIRHCNEVYHRLGVLLKDTDLKSESAYNDELPRIVDELKSAGLVTQDNGAQCIFLPEFEKNGKPVPMIIQKSDGGFLYHTTDLAALKYRITHLKANRIFYVVDIRQSDHFKMLFSAAKKAGWLTDEVQATHVAFGTILGKDNKPFKTREGGTVRLIDLLHESIKRAQDLIHEKDTPLSEDEKDTLADQLGIGAVKYADLSSDRKNDYVFDWDRLLSFDGNTAPYLQYAFVRIQSLLQKAGSFSATRDMLDNLLDDKEFALIKKIADFPDIIQKSAERLEPHHMAVYLFGLAQAFTHFYDVLPIMKAASDEERVSRLWLSEQVARIISLSLQILGIESPARM